MKKYPFLKDIISLGKIFNKSGFSLYLVGGALRDFLLKKDNHDYDFTTDATPEEVISLFPHNTILTGLKHGTVTVRYNKTCYEITTFRVEGAYSDHRHPDSVEFVRDLREDLSRRDFTINAFAANTMDGIIIDYHDGINDLKNRLIRAIGKAEDRFNEDALRMLRAVRFAAKLNFNIEEDTFNAIKNGAQEIVNISKERVRDELFKLLDSDYPSYGLRLLKESNLLKYILPELDEAYNFEQLGYHKDDLFNHTLKAVEEAKNYPFIVKLSALFHDLGKLKTRAGDGTNGYTFYSHEIESAKIAHLRLRELKCSNEVVSTAENLVKNHMFNYQSNFTDAAIRRFILRVGLENIPLLFDLRRSDALAIDINSKFALLDELQERIEIEVERQNALKLTDLKINGHDLIALGIKGKLIGQTLSYLLDEVLEDPTLNQKEKLIELARSYIKRLLVD